MAFELMGYLPYIALASLALIGAMIFYIFFMKRGKQIDPLKILLKTPSIKPKILYCGKSTLELGAGVPFDAEVLELEASGDLATIKANDPNIGNFTLCPVSKTQNLISIEGWTNVAGNGILYLCNVDATNRVHPWDEVKKAAYINSQMELKAKKLEGKQEMFESVELANSLVEPFKTARENDDVGSENSYGR